jgi:hypothetical protein
MMRLVQTLRQLVLLGGIAGFFASLRTMRYNEDHLPGGKVLPPG